MSLPGCVRASRELELLFEQCFLASFNTRLCGGAAEPLYQPSEVPGEPHRLFYRDDYVASALHETAHWCIAGYQRRQHVDFGYWYVPDGRNAQQQRQFECVEVKPQALECVFSHACGLPFRVSVDNLDGDAESGTRFVRAVTDQFKQYCETGLPARAQTFFNALANAYRPGLSLSDLRLHAAE